MLGLLILASFIRGRVWWEIPNVLGSTFFGTRAFRTGVGMPTLAGVAMHFVITGSLGAIFSLLCGRIRERKRLVILGIFSGLVWYYAGQAFFWSHVNPWFPIYSPAPIAILAHAMFGFCLGFAAPAPVHVEHVAETPVPVADAVE